jgi:hypothetical protein
MLRPMVKDETLRVPNQGACRVQMKDETFPGAQSFILRIQAPTIELELHCAYDVPGSEQTPSLQVLASTHPEVWMIRDGDRYTFSRGPKPGDPDKACHSAASARPRRGGLKKPKADALESKSTSPAAGSDIEIAPIFYRQVSWQRVEAEAEAAENQLARVASLELHTVWQQDGWEKRSQEAKADHQTVLIERFHEASSPEAIAMAEQELWQEIQSIVKEWAERDGFTAPDWSNEGPGAPKPPAAGCACILL